MALKAGENKKLIRTLPHSVEAEQCLLGCVLVDGEVSLDILSNLSDVDFYSPVHQTVFSAMKAVSDSKKPVDFVTVADELSRLGKMTEIGGISYLSTINNSVPSAANWKYYHEIVKKHSVMRQLIHTCSEITDDAYSAEDMEKQLASAESKIYSLNTKSNAGQLSPLYESVSKVLGMFEDIAKNPDKLKGVPSGFKKLDKMTNGFHGGELIIIAGRPGMGKTSLAMNMVEHAALNKKCSCAVFSLEMSRESLTQRSICSVAGVPMSDALSGKLTAQQWESLWNAGEGFSHSKIFIDDTSNITVSQMLSKCRRLKSKYGLDLVLIDYIQLMEADDRKSKENRQTEVASISRNLKIMARELDVPVLALSQLRREQAGLKNKKPQLSDLRESGAIEQDADIVLMIYKPEEEGETESASTRVELVVAKHRNGPLGDIPLDWIGEIVRFTEADAYSLAITAQFNKNKAEKAKREKEKQQETQNEFEAPLPDEAPPEEEGTVIEGDI